MPQQPQPPPQTVHDFHPLEVIPFFRRFRPGFWRDIVYTFIWNAGIAVLFAVLALLWAGRVDPLRLFALNFVYAQCIGYTIHALYLVGYLLVPRERLDTRAMRTVFLGIVPAVGFVLGAMLARALLGGTVVDWIATPRGVVALLLNAALIVGVLLAVMLPRERAAQARGREEARVAAAEREAAIAQLKALEAQVEPHFLYNTLAHVASLIDSDPQQARRMLDRLIAWLRSTARCGGANATLGGQADLVRTYLEILGLRMGRRLAWTIDVPPELDAVALPPSLLQPLVENAVKHGIEPMIDGGTIAIAARRSGGDVEITVADTGRGFSEPAATPIGGSTRLGLSVLKQRLAALYGNAASLVLTENRPRGVRATLRIPLQVPGTTGSTRNP